jgi:hypothetical protein
MPIIEIALIQVRRGQEYQTGVPQLQPGEMAWAEDTENLYIGKRILEGASNDLNSRILTDKDLSTIFQIAQSSVAQASSSTAYRYRGDIPYGNQVGQLMSTTSTYANKLNNWVSLTDFNPVWPPFGTNDITSILQNAIGIIASNNISSGVVFQNGTGVGPVPIKIPPGNWTISGTVSLPPFTTLIGDGIGMTVLTYISGNNSSNPMFQTVDANGLSFTEGMASSNGQNARHINLTNMSLHFPEDFVADSTLISLDNVQDVYIDNVFMGNTTTTAITGNPIGIRIRTTGVANPDLTLAPSNNINITHCIFNRMSLGVFNQGSVDRFTIRDNEFNWLSQAVTSYSLTTLNGMNILIDNNKFENIGEQAIFMGTLTNAVTSYVVSSNNTFRNVGCGFIGEGGQSKPVITFNDQGGQSVNDYFDRQVATPAGSYMYPWVSGNASISSGAAYSVAIPKNSTVSVIKIPLTTRVQMATFNYTLSNASMFRSGQLLMNIAPVADAFANVGDNYAYGERTEFASDKIAFTTNMTNATTKNYITLDCQNFDAAVDTTLEYTITLLN